MLFKRRIQYFYSKWPKTYPTRTQVTIYIWNCHVCINIIHCRLSVGEKQSMIKPINRGIRQAVLRMPYYIRFLHTTILHFYIIDNISYHILHLSTTCIYCIYATITLKYKLVVMYSYFTFMKALHDHLLIASHTHIFIYLTPRGMLCK